MTDRCDPPSQNKDEGRDKDGEWKERWEIVRRHSIPFTFDTFCTASLNPQQVVIGLCIYTGDLQIIPVQL